MNNNQAYVICIESEIGQHYLGQRDGIMCKIIGAVFYHDEMFAKSELGRVIEEYRDIPNSFFSDVNKLSIKMIEINII